MTCEIHRIMQNAQNFYFLIIRGPVAYQVPGHHTPA